MTTAEQNYRLLQEIEANRRFLLMAYQQNPELLERADSRIKQMFEGSMLLAPPLPHPLPQGEEKANPFQLMGKSDAGGKQRGISLIELIMFIVIISVALTGILLVMNQVTRHSADPLVHKQAVAIAESLLEEVELMPFTFCDPDDASAVTATAAVVGVAGGCATTAEAMGPEGTEARGSTTNPFDNVNDYNTFNMAAGAVVDITGGAAVSGYAASVAVTQAALGTVPAAESLQITVTVTGPDTVPIVLDGYRTRYAPGSVP